MYEIDPRMKTRLSPRDFNTLLESNPPRVVEGGMIMTGAVRLSWPALAEPSKPRLPGAAPKYQAYGLFYRKDIDVFTDAIKAAIRLAYPSLADPGAMINLRDAKTSPIKDQGMKVAASEGGYEPIKKTLAGYVTGFPYITAKSDSAVPCFYAAGGRPTLLLGDQIKQELYSGCWVTIKIRPYKSKTATGVFLGLQGIMKLADDVSFGGVNDTRAEDFSDAVAIENPNAVALPDAVAAVASMWE